MKLNLTVAFAGHNVRIVCPDKTVHDAVSFMFQPHTLGADTKPDSRLRIAAGRNPGHYHLLRKKKRIARNRKLADLFISLYDAVIHDVISPASNGLALHAGAVSRNGITLLIPGVSGAGKSTLTSWFISRGWSYLSDELVYLVKDAPAEYLTRPLSIKTGAVDTVSTLYDYDIDEKLLYRSRQGIYLHHSIFNNSAYSGPPPRPSKIVFPAWEKDADFRLEPLTAAHCATRLMNVLVNARNLPRHGVPEIIRLATSRPAFMLHYSGFEQLEVLEDALAAESALPDKR